MLKCPHGHDMRIRLPFSRPRPVWWPGVRWLPDAFRERGPVRTAVRVEGWGNEERDGRGWQKIRRRQECSGRSVCGPVGVQQDSHRALRLAEETTADED